MTDRVQPRSLDAERAVLGSILVSRKAMSTVTLHLGRGDFYSPANSSVFSAMQALDARSQPIDQITLAEQLADKLEKVGGVDYLRSLVEPMPNVLRVETYARIVADRARARRVIAAATEIAARGYEPVDDVEDYLAWAQGHMQRACATQTRSGPQSVESAADVEYDRIDKSSQGTGVRYGVDCGFVDLDRVLGGLQRGRVTVVAARPGVGKSALAKDIVVNVARQGVASLMVSLEMSSGEVVRRMIAAEGSIENCNLVNASMTPDEWQVLPIAVDRVRRLGNVWFPGAQCDKLHLLRAMVREMYASHDVRFVVIDYLQLMSAGYPSTQRVQEIQAITSGLKSLAMNLDIPILVLSQLTRESAKRTGRPLLTDLRESGSIEQDADSVVLLSVDAKAGQGDGLSVIAADVQKNRGGRRGLVRMAFDARYTRFADLEEHHGG